MINFFAFSENDIFLPQIVFTVRYDKYSVLVPAFKPVAVYTTSVSFFYAKLFSLYLQVFFSSIPKIENSDVSLIHHSINSSSYKANDFNIRVRNVSLSVIKE